MASEELGEFVEVEDGMVGGGVFWRVKSLTAVYTLQSPQLFTFIFTQCFLMNRGPEESK